ncbi:aminoglycoside phosphotransferase family protein [Microbacterium sp. ET2]|uniref:aminoglycoside phosphotransferase family protein n=1 Tax=Microbacterium albipurpureum TaxID=3050384 RepID=UPI00259C99C7|nr:aminoglycoside phosphotransferase family protein [Microbacterium sp. ET2 (Ac-2212)]WJL94283.1 aminoglycoside phosphotransferase family protein [Microbacterium sp. ET2 (Ac-2212)]
MTGSHPAPAIDASRIDAQLVRALIAEQFPEWAHLPVRSVPHGGNDHRMFRLGEALSVRLPSAPGYVPQVAKEQRWLPHLAPSLPLPIPAVHGAGRPSRGFAGPWSVYGWIEGDPAGVVEVDDASRFAADLAAFLVALRAVDAAGGPSPGLHSGYRGGPLAHYDDETAAIIDRLSGRERDLAGGMWRDALAASFDGPPVWVHGDVSINNLLARDGRLSAVVDFGCSAVGDPACDTVIAWTFFDGPAARVFRRELAVDDGTWVRGRGWALWKALIMITHIPADQRLLARRVLDRLFAER